MDQRPFICWAKTGKTEFDFEGRFVDDRRRRLEKHERLRNTVDEDEGELTRYEEGRRKEERDERCSDSEGKGTEGNERKENRLRNAVGEGGRKVPRIEGDDGRSCCAHEVRMRRPKSDRMTRCSTKRRKKRQTHTQQCVQCGAHLGLFLQLDQLSRGVQEMYVSLGAKPEWHPGPQCAHCGVATAPWWDRPLWRPARRMKENKWTYVYEGEESGADKDVDAGHLESTRPFYRRRRINKSLPLEDEEKDEEDKKVWERREKSRR